MEPALSEETSPLDRGIEPALREVATNLYRHMVRLRLVSARMVQLQRAEKIAFHAACLGEEAVIAAAALAARPGDWIFPGVREWGSALVRGMPIATYVHHAFGSGEDPAKGHAAPDHPPARRFAVAPASGILGAHVPQAVGAAWAAKIRKEDVATVALFGDAVASGGDFHNALNFAGVFKAPCVFVCRNHAGDRNAFGTADTRAVAYGVASAKVDGSDAIAVFGLVQAAIARAAAGKGATLIEAITRPLPLTGAASLDGASPGATGTWGPELLGEGASDPVARLRRALDREKLLDVEGAEAIAREARAEIDAAVAAAERAAPLATGSIFEHVYAEVPPHLRAQKEEASQWRR
ncbi:MAG: 3-methyl-2-oxobutanoate dehydrogenase [Labilithrix sp.]|nr:3-methyl-2-oxobutanoate dehydrogenase [Labilithrix sp.]